MLTVLCAAGVRGGMHRQTNRSGVDGLPGTCQPNYEKAQFPIGCERALPPPFPGWLGLAAGLGGSCTSPESPAIEAQCNEAVRGAWSLAEARTEAEAVQACRAGCVRCAKCAYVSVSWTKRTCSWYSACDTSRLAAGGAHGATFRTYFARELDMHSIPWSTKAMRQWRLHRMHPVGATAVQPTERSPRVWVIDTSVDECRNSRQGKVLGLGLGLGLELANSHPHPHPHPTYPNTNLNPLTKP